MGSSAKSTTSARSNGSANSNQSARVRAAILAKQRIEGVLEKKKLLAETLNRRAFLRRCGSSRSMEARLDSMEMELSDFEKAIGLEILGPAEMDGKSCHDEKSAFTFDLAAKKLGKNNKEDADDAQSEATPFDEEGEDQKTSSAESKSTHDAKSAITRKVSNVGKIVNSAPALSPQVEQEDADEESADDSHEQSDDEGDDESDGEEEVGLNPQIVYKQKDGEAFRWFDRIVREGDFCIDYTCRLIECDPTEMYSRTKAAIADMTHMHGTEEPELVDEDEVQKEEKDEKPQKEAPPKKKWFRRTSNNTVTIELGHTDPAIEDLTDSDSWMSEDKTKHDDSDDDVPKKYESKLLSSSPEEYFAAINASPPVSPSRVGGRKKKTKKVKEVMCEI